MARASARLLSRSANQARRALSKELRAWLKRCHSADSVALSSLAPERWCCFHWSSRVAHPLAAGLPLGGGGRLPGDLLGLGDDGLALRRWPRRGPRRGARPRAPAWWPDRPRPARRWPAGPATSPTTPVDSTCSLSVAQSVGDLLGGDVGVGQPRLEQVGRRRELVVLAGEVLQGLVGRRARVGADLALLVADGDEDVALVVDPAEPRRLRVAHRCRGGRRARVHPGEGGRRGDRRAGGGLVVGHGQAFFSVTATRRMLIGAAGNPSVELVPPGATPAAAILSTISNPEVTVPNTV